MFKDERETPAHEPARDEVEDPLFTVEDEIDEEEEGDDVFDATDEEDEKDEDGSLGEDIVEEGDTRRDVQPLTGEVGSERGSHGDLAKPSRDIDPLRGSESTGIGRNRTQG